MTIGRNIAAKGFALGVAALGIVLVAVGCVAPEALRAGERGSQQQKAAEVDLTGANLDKRKFLIGISMLGKSVKEDIEILRKMTGHMFEFDRQEDLPTGETRYSTFTPSFEKNPGLINGRYTYSVMPDGKHKLFTFLVVNQKTMCISLEDIESALGKPTRIINASEVPAKGLGPSPIWNVIYDLQTGGRAWFQFSTALCINDISQSSERIEWRK